MEGAENVSGAAAPLPGEDLLTRFRCHERGLEMSADRLWKGPKMSVVQLLLPEEDLQSHFRCHEWVCKAASDVMKCQRTGYRKERKCQWCSAPSGNRICKAASDVRKGSAKPLQMSKNVSKQAMEGAENVSGAAPPPGRRSAYPLAISGRCLAKRGQISWV